MAFSSKKWSFFASRIYSLLIILQIPLFRFPCRIGVCTTPIEVTCSELIATEVYPAGVMKVLVYPGATAKAIVKSNPIPTFTNILNLYNSPQTQTTHLHHIEVLAGSYLAVVGGIMGPFKKGRRLGLIGILLIIWGLSNGNLKHALGDGDGDVDEKKDFSICYPTMGIAVLSAFFSITRDARKIISFLNSITLCFVAG